MANRTDSTLGPLFPHGRSPCGLRARSNRPAACKRCHHVRLARARGRSHARVGSGFGGGYALRARDTIGLDEKQVRIAKRLFRSTADAAQAPVRFVAQN